MSYRLGTQWYQEGYAAGQTGGDPDCPYTPGDEDFRLWQAGYQAGLYELVDAQKNSNLNNTLAD